MLGAVTSGYKSRTPLLYNKVKKMATMRLSTQFRLIRRQHIVASFINLRPVTVIHASCNHQRLFGTDVSSDPHETFSDSESTADVDEVRNVSRLSPNHYRQYHGKPPELPYKDLVMRQKLFSKFGLDSNEDPRIMWPSRKKLIEMEQEEKEEATNIHERLKTLHDEKAAAEKARIERHKMIEKNMSQMPKMIADYKKRLENADKEIQLRQAKKNVLLEEAREYFGYKIQANDPKFEKMMEERAEEEKKQAKKLKKEEKLKKAAAKLAQEAKMFENKSAQK